ncbi:MAG: sodium:proton antiporter, partial [Bacteroidales bacterium]|nr:sodium:proton antiporter [Bacteroidales bacterium]
ISIVLTGKLFSDSFEKHDLAPEVLSRTIEDSATVSSVLIPWNSCGATQARVLGVATVAYLPYCFFCYLSPVINILFVLFKIKLRKRIIAAA